MSQLSNWYDNLDEKYKTIEGLVGGENQQNQQNQQQSQYNIDLPEFDYEYETPESMDYEVALRQAEEILGPQFERQKENVLGKMASEQASRGFYGQAPADAARQSAVADLLGRHQGNVASMGQNLKQQDWQREMQEEQMQFKSAQQGWQNALQEEQLGLQKWQTEQQLNLQQQQMEQKEKNNFWSGLGSLVGTVGGFMVGGPAGAGIGSQLGSWLGGEASGVTGTGSSGAGTGGSGAVNFDYKERW